jgi:hypothetical protein
MTAHERSFDEDVPVTHREPSGWRWIWRIFPILVKVETSHRLTQLTSAQYDGADSVQQLKVRRKAIQLVGNRINPERGSAKRTEGTYRFPDSDSSNTIGTLLRDEQRLRAMGEVGASPLVILEVAIGGDKVQALGDVSPNIENGFDRTS